MVPAMLGDAVRLRVKTNRRGAEKAEAREDFGGWEICDVPRIAAWCRWWHPNFAFHQGSRLPKEVSRQMRFNTAHLGLLLRGWKRSATG